MLYLRWLWYMDYKGLHAFPSNITRDDPPITRDYPPFLLALQGRWAHLVVLALVVVHGLRGGARLGLATQRRGRERRRHVPILRVCHKGVTRGARLAHTRQGRGRTPHTTTPRGQTSGTGRGQLTPAEPSSCRVSQHPRTNTHAQKTRTASEKTHAQRSRGAAAAETQ